MRGENVMEGVFACPGRDRLAVRAGRSVVGEATENSRPVEISGHARAVVGRRT